MLALAGRVHGVRRAASVLLGEPKEGGRSAAIAPAGRDALRALGRREGEDDVPQISTTWKMPSGTFASPPALYVMVYLILGLRNHGLFPSFGARLF